MWLSKPTWSPHDTCTHVVFAYRSSSTLQQEVKVMLGKMEVAFEADFETMAKNAGMELKKDASGQLVRPASALKPRNPLHAPCPGSSCYVQERQPCTSSAWWMPQSCLS